MLKLLLVGPNSTLAKEFCSEEHPGISPVLVTHSEVKDVEFDKYDCVVNFALNPDFATSEYHESIDFDRYLAGLIGEANTHYIMLSSRAVYGPKVAMGASETAPTLGANVYGRNKACAEQAVESILGSQCTILRIGNVVGFERTAGRRTFMGIMLHGLKERGEITLDVSPHTRRDFIPDKVFTRIVQHMILARPGGVYNVGSGIPIELGNLANWVIEGFGLGDLKIISTEKRDEFALDVSKLKNFYGPVCTSEDIKRYCNSLGKRLSDE